MRAIIADFKTLGAKRYLLETDGGKIKMTVSGVNPKRGAEYLVNRYGKNGAFSHFDIDLTIPADCTGKLTHTYIDDECSGEIADYTGRVGYYHEKSYIHLSPCEYSMTIGTDFLDFLKGVREENEI